MDWTRGSSPRGALKTRSCSGFDSWIVLVWSLNKQEGVLDFMVSMLLSASVERVCLSSNRISFKEHNGKKKNRGACWWRVCYPQGYPVYFLIGSFFAKANVFLIWPGLYTRADSWY